jgi:hypothetical protein
MIEINVNWIKLEPTDFYYKVMNDNDGTNSLFADIGTNTICTDIGNDSYYFNSGGKGMSLLFVIKTIKEKGHYTLLTTDELTERFINILRKDKLSKIINKI